MTNALGQSNWRCWVIEHSGALAGALWLQLIEKVPNPTSEPETYAYITNFYVVDALRGKGLGSRMLDEALKWCREQDAHMVILWPSDKSRPLYERYGFKIRDDILGLLIEDRD